VSVEDGECQTICVVRGDDVCALKSKPETASSEVATEILSEDILQRK
jgi:hypothetical protein